MIFKQTRTANKNVLDRIGEDSGGNLTYKGLGIGGGDSSLPNAETLQKIGEFNGAITFNGLAVGGGTGGGTVSGSNLVTGGSVRFKVDFIAQTISWTPFHLVTSSGVSTTSAGSLTGLTMLGDNTIHFLGFRSGTFEIVNSLAGYAGLVVFAMYQKNLFPLAYSPNLIGVRGAVIYGRKDLSVGEWALIGDSISFLGAFSNVLDHINIPIVNNLAVAGMKMAGATGMWTKVASVTPTTELCTIMGGTNDQGAGDTPTGSLIPIKSTFDTNTYYGAYQYVIEGLLNLNSKMVIILATPPRAWTDGTGTTERTAIKNYADATKSIGQFYGLPVVDLYNNFGVNGVNQAVFFGNDGLHPNTYGKLRTSALMLDQIKKSFMTWV